MWSSEVTRSDIPAGTLIAACMPVEVASREQTHLDCFRAELDGAISLEDFVRAFYTTWLFRSERFVLKLARMPSTDEDLDSLLLGTRKKFAAWTVEQRSDNELLMCDVASKTKSWFMVEPGADASSARTVVYFGTVVVATAHRRTGEPDLGVVFRLFMPAHLLYGRSLLITACSRLRQLTGPS